MKTPGKFRPALFALLASSLLAADLTEARPRIIWTTPSLTSAEIGAGKSLFVGTDGFGNASDAPSAALWSVNQDTSARSTIFRRSGFSVASNVAFRPLTFSKENKTLFATFSSPARILAINPSNGNAQWDVAIRATSFIGEIALTKEGNVILPIQGGGVSLLNRNNGKAKWLRSDLNVLTPDAPAIGSGAVVFVHSATIQGGNSRNANVVALNSRDGNTIWEAVTGLASPTSQPVVAPKQLVIVSGNGILAFNANNGREVWDTGSGNFGKPVVADDLVVVASNRQLAGLRLNNGSPKWVRSIQVPTSDPVYTANGMVLIGTGNEVQAFDAKSGRLRWRIGTTGIVRDITAKGNRYFCALSNSNAGTISEIVAIRD